MKTHARGAATPRRGAGLNKKNERVKGAPAGRRAEGLGRKAGRKEGKPRRWNCRENCAGEFARSYFPSCVCFARATNARRRSTGPSSSKARSSAIFHALRRLSFPGRPPLISFSFALIRVPPGLRWALKNLGAALAGTLATYLRR